MEWDKAASNKAVTESPSISEFSLALTTIVAVLFVDVKSNSDVSIVNLLPPTTSFRVWPSAMPVAVTV